MPVRVFLPNFKRAVNLKLAVAAILFAFAIALDTGFSVIDVLVNYDISPWQTCVFYYYFMAISFGGVYCHYFAAMLAALPYSASHAEEAGMYPFVLIRAGVRRNCAAKMLCSSITGGFALACGAAFFLLALASRMPLVTSDELFAYQWIPFYALLNTGSGALYFAVCVYLQFLTGFLWGGAAVLVSAYIKNKFVVFASPFVLSFVLTQICRLLRLGDDARLDYLLSGRAWLGSGAATLLAATAAVLVIWSACTAVFIRKARGDMR
ncbi:MAG: hypothetical protein LBD92_03860 [Oscillospiraceae bacterium]|jgi:hypothetical protein|nr:hypothetical protein [Oscillospiraceae bacterium]